MQYILTSGQWLQNDDGAITPVDMTKVNKDSHHYRYFSKELLDDNFHCIPIDVIMDLISTWELEDDIEIHVVDGCIEYHVPSEGICYCPPYLEEAVGTDDPTEEWLVAIGMLTTECDPTAPAGHIANLFKSATFIQDAKLAPDTTHYITVPIGSLSDNLG